MSKHSTSSSFPRVTFGSFVRPLFVVALTIGIVACGGAPTKPSPTPSEVIEIETPPEPQTIPRYSEAHEALFYQIEDALALRDWQTAEILLSKLPADTLNARDQVQQHRLQAQVSYLRGDTMAAASQLNTVLNVNTDNDLYKETLQDLQHQLRLSNQHLQSAYLGHRAISRDAENVDDNLLNGIWVDLQNSSTSDIAQALSNANNDPQWQGWLQLASLDNPDNRPSASALNLAISEWLSAHPDHPASLFLPGGLEFLIQAPQAQRIALLLPLSGRLATAGKAVRDGFLAAYYQQVAAYGNHQLIDLIDSASYPDVEQAYYAAESTGADIIVGPLDKERVKTLDEFPLRALPVIALNRTDKPQQAGQRALIQLALAPQDEAKQLARLAYGRGFRQAMVIAPDSNWGKKMAGTLRQQWRELGGSISTEVNYENNAQLSSSIENALALKDSQSRRRQVAAKFGQTDISFQPRRRQDIDVVFMLTNNLNDARSIKPLLSFYYANNIPVLSTSAIYNTQAARNKDLAGVGILETPWRLNSNSLRASLGKAGNGRLAALYALGADAYLLQSRFAQLGAGENAVLRGSSGNLRLNKKLQIERTLQPATFDGQGRIKTP